MNIYRRLKILCWKPKLQDVFDDILLFRSYLNEWCLRLLLLLREWGDTAHTESERDGSGASVGKDEWRSRKGTLTELVSFAI